MSYTSAVCGNERVLAVHVWYLQIHETQHRIKSTMSRLCDGCMGQCILRAGMEGTRLYTYKPTCTLQMNFDVRSHVTGVIFASELFHVRHVALIIQVSYKGQTHLYYGYASCYLRQRSCGVNAIPVCLSVCLSVCYQDISKRRIWTKFRCVQQ